MIWAEKPSNICWDLLHHIRIRIIPRIDYTKNMETSWFLKIKLQEETSDKHTWSIQPLVAIEQADQFVWISQGPKAMLVHHEDGLLGLSLKKNKK